MTLIKENDKNYVLSQSNLWSKHLVAKSIRPASPCAIFSRYVQIEFAIKLLLCSGGPSQKTTMLVSEKVDKTKITHDNIHILVF